MITDVTSRICGLEYFLTSTGLRSGTIYPLCPLTAKEVVVDTRGLEKTRVIKERTMTVMAEDEIFIFSPWLMVMRVASKINGSMVFVKIS